jgi:hypothetical protein
MSSEGKKAPVALDYARPKHKDLRDPLFLGLAALVFLLPVIVFFVARVVVHLVSR